MRQGNAITVTAIDPVSGAEARATGPLNARVELERIAVQKLQRQLGRVPQKSDDEPSANETPPVSRRGIII